MYTLNHQQVSKFALASIRCNKNLSSRASDHHRHKKFIILLLFTCVFLETFAFNYAHWESLTFTTASGDVSIGEGLKTKGKDTYVVTDPDTASFSFSTDAHIENVYIPLSSVITNVQSLGSPKKPTGKLVDTQSTDQNLHIVISADEQGATVPWVLPEVTVNNEAISSQWIRLHLSGVSKKISIHVNQKPGTVINFSAPISFNTVKPFIINPIRILLYVLILMFGMILLIPHRKLISPTSPALRKSLWFAAFAVALAIAEGALLAMRPWHALKLSAWPADYEYQWMAQSILNKHTWIDYPMNTTLKHMANPYDTGLRQQLLNASNGDFLNDFVLFKGKYYSYFGVLPCLLFFVPFRFLTGTDLSSWKVVFVLLLIIVALAFGVARALFRRFAPQTPELVQIVCAICLSIITQPALYISSTTSATYSIPIASAIVLAYTSIYLWLLASTATSRKKLLVYTALGGFSTGLIVGCRPQIAIIIFLAPVILSNRLNDLKEKGQRYAWLTAAGATAVSCLIAMIPFLWWNFIRFGKLLDFGATYQLTTMDMRVHRDIVSKLPFAFSQAFFAPLRVLDKFPFFAAIAGNGNSQGGYQGIYMAEPLLGGVLFWLPAGWLILFAIKRRVRTCARNQTGVSALLYSALGLCLVILTIDTSATFLTRYVSDWGFLWGIASLSAIMMLDNAIEDKTLRRVLHTSVIALSLASICLCIVAVTVSGRFNQLSDSNPLLFTLLRDLFTVMN